MHRWAVRNFLFPIQEFAKGHRTLRILSEMEEADRMSAAELERFSNRKLKEFLDYCYAHVPFIKARMDDAGIHPSQIRHVRDLSRLPTTTKEDVRRHRLDLRSDIARNLVEFATGGSSGEPLIFDLAKRRIAARVACRQRVSAWWGLSVGDPEIALWGCPVELTRQHWMQEIRDRLFATRLLSAFEMSKATISKYLDIIEHGTWRQIFAYPSAIYQLCLQGQKEGRDMRRVGIRAVFVTGEVLFPYQRELISETLGCPVANWYGGRDCGCIANECPQGGMHILADATIVEILDAEGRVLPAGEIGTIAVTDLYSHEAPFIRYITGDMGSLSSKTCACGRALPLLERIEGRSNDMVIAPDGRIINSLALIYPVREVPGIERFRVVQTALDRFRIHIVRTDQFPPDGADRIRQNWTKLLRSPITITFEYVPHLPVLTSGKFRHFISEVSNLGLPKKNQ